MASPFDFSSFLLTPPIPTPGNAGSGDYGNRNDGQMNVNSLPYSMRNFQHSGADPPNPYQHDTGQRMQYQQQQQRSDSMQGTSNQGQNMHYQQQYPVGQGSMNVSVNDPNNMAKQPSLDERDYGLDPSAFSNVSFAMPSFLVAASSSSGQFEGETNVVDPLAFYSAPTVPAVNPAPVPPAAPQRPPNVLPPPIYNDPIIQRLDVNQPRLAVPQRNPPAESADKQKYAPNTLNPVYGVYGSSVISVNPDPAPFKMAPNSTQQAVLDRQPPQPYVESRGNTPDFDPRSLGLPIGEQLFPQPLPGLYSTSGFDMLGVLARVVARPCPQINIGPVDTSCSFLVVDARRYDMPIVFASETFSRLTGYTNSEIIGRNCRFLQAPDGHVAAGSRRKYTDGNAVFHLKTHIASGKETQASIINYRKDGSPFINLVTVIPIAWDTDEIAYFVGFQVDLVEQPNAILEKMRNGTYVVNYSLLPTNPLPLPSASHNGGQNYASNEDPPINVDADAWMEPKAVRAVDQVPSASATAAVAQSTMTIAPELLDVMGQVDSHDDNDDESAKKRWNKMLLDNTGDFVHVLSLKGSFLYVSPSVKGMLEYEPTDLVGKTLQSVCHPSDIVPVMRELKEASTVAHPYINLLYRFRRKSSGYVWMEAQGKLYLEQSKSRKCVILVGRERPVYKLSWADLQMAGGLGDKEYWSKITSDGLFLYNTPTIKQLLGYDAEELRGTNMYRLTETDKVADLTKALRDAASGTSVRLHHKLKNSKGLFVDVITNFYPNCKPIKDARTGIAGVVHPSIICQTSEYSSDVRRRATKPQNSYLPKPLGVADSPANIPHPGKPAFVRAHSSAVKDMIVTTPDPHGSGSDEAGKSPRDGARSGSGSGAASGSDSSAPSTFSAIPSTYKALLNSGHSQNENLFDELDTTHTTSWQYELHQLKLTNKKLKEELQMLQAAKRKRKKKEESLAQTNAGGPAAPAQPVPIAPAQKQCANCGRTDSPEWRVGPSGIRNLCNACGLRWAKATRTSRQTSQTPASTTPSSNSDLESAFQLGSASSSALGPFAGGRPLSKHSLSNMDLMR